MSQKAGSNNRQVQRTRTWIFEALMLLLDEKPYGKIGISDLAKKAGIARQTFYRNYRDKDDIVLEYLMNTINLELPKADGGKKGNRQNNFVLTFNFSYMIEHRENLRKLLSIVDIEHRIHVETQDFPLKILEQYKRGLSAREYLICRYKLYYQMTGCLQVFFDWFINDMPMPLDSIVSLLNAMNVPKTIQHRHIPNIVVHVNKG